MEKIKVTSGLYWVEIPEVNLSIMCGSPADSVKHLMKRGLIQQKEKNGIKYETGPNAILLSDVSVQNGNFSNLAEFPVLQMFYRQGMLIPNHPNNTGTKPMLIGISEQVKAQSLYIYRGNYGLVSEEEIMKSGISAEQAHEMMRLKRRFAFDNIMDTKDLLDLRIVDKEAVELKDGVYIHRKSFNVYEFMYNGKSVTVDLNLALNEEYEPPYHLGFHRIKREYFSVINTGEGDGWDVNRPCMASIIIFQGKIYLIDAGPNMLNSLTALGISVNEIEGIFHTHAHDDHFAGLTTLIRSDHLIKYYATPLVLASVVKKLSALLGMDEERFSKYFDVHTLEFDKWNDIEGLEVMPILSPHPVETSIMTFRALGYEGYKTYAHWADIAAFDVLDKMVTDDPAKSGITKEFCDKIKEIYLTPATLKKIDIGGGMIHGRAEDFTGDKSERIFLSHTALPLTDEQKEIGSNAEFGMQDILIPAHHDFTRRTAFKNLRSYFPDTPETELEMLMNCPIVPFNPGAIVIKKDVVNKDIYLVITGVLEFIDSERNIKNRMSAGTLAGELSALLNEPSRGTYRAASYVQAYRIPAELYLDFVKSNYLYEDIFRVHGIRYFLRSTWLFGDMVSYPIQNRVAQRIETIACPAGNTLVPSDGSNLYMLADGEMELCAENKLIEQLTPGEFTCEESVLFDIPSLFSARAVKDSTLHVVPGSLLSDIPTILWKLIETFDKRMRMLNTQFDFEWRAEYSIGIERFDAQHKELFEIINDLCNSIVSKSERLKMGEKFELLLGKAKKHFEDEENFLSNNKYDETAVQKTEHKKLLEDLAGFRQKIEHCNAEDQMECIIFLKNWMITHTLVHDKRYGQFMKEKGVR